MSDVNQLIESMVGAVRSGVAPEQVASGFLDEGEGSPLGYAVVALKDLIAAGKVNADRASCEAWLRENMRHLDDQWIKLVCDKLQTLNLIAEPVEEAVVVADGGKYHLMVGDTRVGNVFETPVAAAQFAEGAGFVLAEGDDEEDDVDEGGAKEDDDDMDEGLADTPAVLSRTQVLQQVTEGDDAPALLVPEGTQVVRESEMPGGEWLVTIAEGTGAGLDGKRVSIAADLLQALPEAAAEPEEDDEDEPVEEAATYRFFSTSGEPLCEHQGADQTDALTRVLAEGHELQNVDLSRTELVEAEDKDDEDDGMDEAAFELKKSSSGKGLWFIQKDGKTVGSVEKGADGGFQAVMGKKHYADTADSQRAMGSSAAGALKALLKTAKLDEQMQRQASGTTYQDLSRPADVKAGTATVLVQKGSAKLKIVVDGEGECKQEGQLVKMFGYDDGHNAIGYGMDIIRDRNR